MWCQAAIADGRGHFVIDTIEIQAPQGDEILVEIKAAKVNNLRANEFVLTVRQTRQQTEDAKDEGGKA